jgi:precorrin-6A/cobalt-precorrin-6A reductase
MRRILILGGTTEARQLAEQLAERSDFSITVSLAGRTALPAAYAVPVRTGGFGGVAGLSRYLETENVDVLVDATHPHAAVISRNAIAAAERTGTPILALRRRPWLPEDGDRWTPVPDVPTAVAAVGSFSRRAFVALGRTEVGAFEAAPQHFYLFRSVEPIEPRLNVPHSTYLTARGPFAKGDELELLRSHEIEILICKNSGGLATFGKIAAARSLGLPVIMVDAPPPPPMPSVASVAEAIHWLHHAPRSETLRGV